MFKQHEEKEAYNTNITSKPYPADINHILFLPNFIQPQCRPFNETPCLKQHVAQFESRCGKL